MDRTMLRDFLAVVAVAVVVFLGLLYAEVVYEFDAMTLFVSVIVPLLFGTLVFLARRNFILLFAFLGYIWAIVDDRPVFFDSLLTWPEVTRFHPFLPRLEMNIVIHILTAVFFYLSIREAMKGSGVKWGTAPRVAILGVAAYVLAYAQNIPLPAIQDYVAVSWYPFDIAEKFASFFVMWLAVREALKSGQRPTGASPSERAASPRSILLLGEVPAFIIQRFLRFRTNCASPPPRGDLCHGHK